MLGPGWGGGVGGRGMGGRRRGGGAVCSGCIRMNHRAAAWEAFHFVTGQDDLPNVKFWRSPLGTEEIQGRRLEGSINSFCHSRDSRFCPTPVTRPTTSSINQHVSCRPGVIILKCAALDHKLPTRRREWFVPCQIQIQCRRGTAKQCSYGLDISGSQQDRPSPDE